MVHLASFPVRLLVSKNICCLSFKKIWHSTPLWFQKKKTEMRIQTEKKKRKKAWTFVKKIYGKKTVLYVMWHIGRFKGKINEEEDLEQSRSEEGREMRKSVCLYSYTVCACVCAVGSRGIEPCEEHDTNILRQSRPNRTRLRKWKAGNANHFLCTQLLTCQ